MKKAANRKIGKHGTSTFSPNKFEKSIKRKPNKQNEKKKLTQTQQQRKWGKLKNCEKIENGLRACLENISLFYEHLATSPAAKDDATISLCVGEN